MPELTEAQTEGECWYRATLNDFDFYAACACNLSGTLKCPGCPVEYDKEDE